MLAPNGPEIRISSFATSHRSREGERRARAKLALGPDLGVVQLDELARQRQPEAGALHLLVGGPDLPKLLEHRFLIFWRDANPGVAHRHLDHAVPRYCVDINSAAFRRELDRVGEQIQEDLPNLPLVALQLAESLIDRGVQRDAAPRRPLAD